MAKLTQARAVYKARLLEALQACKANAGNDGGLAFWQAELRTVLERQIGKLAAVAVAEVQAEAQERGSKVDRALAALQAERDAAVRRAEAVASHKRDGRRQDAEVGDRLDAALAEVASLRAELARLREPEPMPEADEAEWASRAEAAVASLDDSEGTDIGFWQEAA